MSSIESNLCLFCNEPESVCHLFFECVVANVCWSYLADILHINLGYNFEAVARWWVSNNKYKILNSCSAALMWCLWKTRNEFYFQGKSWLGEKPLVRRMVNMLQNWRILFSDGDLEALDQVLMALNIKLNQPLTLLDSQRSSLPEVIASSLATSTGRSTPTTRDDTSTWAPTTTLAVADASTGDLMPCVLSTSSVISRVCAENLVLHSNGSSSEPEP